MLAKFCEPRVKIGLGFRFFRQPASDNPPDHMVRTMLFIRSFLPTLSRISIWFGLIAVCVQAGCEIKVGPPETKPTEIRVPPAQAALVGAGEKQGKQSQQQPDVQSPQPPKSKSSAATFPIAENPQSKPRRDRLAARNSPEKDPDVESQKFKFNVHQAVDRIAAEIRDALSLRKTLVVLLVEQTAQANSLADRISQQMRPMAHDLCASYPGRFEMAVVGYGSDVNLITPVATADPDKLDDALAAIKQSSGDKANLFGAVSAAIEKFLPYRSRDYEVIFIVAGVSPGDDLALADQAIIPLKRAAVQVYGIGPAMPFGTARKKPDKAAPQSSSIAANRRCESLWPERVQLALSGNQNAADLVDSGYGPFGLERLCRLTQGKFFRLRNTEPPNWSTDPTTGDIQSKLLAKYAPDYLDDDQYNRLLAANKCRQALHDAALLPPAEGLDAVRMEFPKQQDEAALAKLITTAQKAAAIQDQPIQKLYDTLIAGEADRPKLTGARWQAGYDLALGQVLAAKARLDGYNAMLALLKQGKTFANPDSTRWILEPADEIAAGSVLDKMAKKSRAVLQRVVTEHPGTPWSAFAERELRYPAGWKLTEK
jgi:hypothetical protein